MRRVSTRTFVGIFLLLTGSLVGCSTPASTTEIAATETLAESPVVQPSPTPEPSPTPVPATATIVHILSPGEPGGASLNLTDVNAASSAPNGGVVLGDRYDSNRFERPFDGSEMNYMSVLDLTFAEIAHDDTWLYFTLTLAGESAEGGYPASYAVEMDMDLDGRGDYLIVAHLPSSITWSDENIRVFSDTNEDVGGATPLMADAPPATSNGFETIIYDSGFGDDPDLAWSRIGQGEDHTIQIAVKQALLDGDNSFLWGVWAFGEPLEAGLLDLNDQATLEQAGSPVIGSTYYPIGELVQVDNTCRMYYGFTPRGTEPGLCSVTGSVRNCSPHPMLMQPGSQVLPPFFENGSILQNIIIGTYTFYDQSVEGNPAVLTAQLVPGGQIQITKTGFGDNYPCQ
jgi:hypothetical protein